MDYSRKRSEKEAKPILPFRWRYDARKPSLKDMEQPGDGAHSALQIQSSSRGFSDIIYGTMDYVLVEQSTPSSWG